MAVPSPLSATPLWDGTVPHGACPVSEYTLTTKSKICAQVEAGRMCLFDSLPPDLTLSLIMLVDLLKHGL